MKEQRTDYSRLPIKPSDIVRVQQTTERRALPRFGPVSRRHWRASVSSPAAWRRMFSGATGSSGAEGTHRRGT